MTLSRKQLYLLQRRIKQTKRKPITLKCSMDEKGTRIAQDTVYMNDLNPNQSGEYKVFAYASRDKLSALKKAKFKVASISMY